MEQDDGDDINTVRPAAYKVMCYRAAINCLRPVAVVLDFHMSPVRCGDITNRQGLVDFTPIRGQVQLVVSCDRLVGRPVGLWRMMRFDVDMRVGPYQICQVDLAWDQPVTAPEPTTLLCGMRERAGSCWSPGQSDRGYYHYCTDRVSLRRSTK